MLAGERAAVLQDELRAAVGDALELRDAFLGLHVHDRPHVQTSDGCMCIDARYAAVAPDHREELVDVVAQHLRLDGRVLDERERLVVPFHGHRQAERHLAEAPDACLIGERHQAAIDALERLEVAFDGLEPRRQILRAVRVELDVQQRAGIVGLQDAAPHPIHRRILARVVEDEPVHHLDGRRLVLQDDRRRGERIEQLVELDREHRLLLRQRDEVDLRRRDHRERPFGADDDLREVERLRLVDELVEVVAADAADDLRIAPLDFLRALERDAAHLAIARRLERVALAGGLELRAIERAEVRLRPVGEDHIQLQDVVDGLAVHHGAGAAGVVADHSADGRAARRRDVGRKPQPVLFELRIQLVEDDARLDDRPAFGHVQLENAVVVLRRVELEPVADRLPSLRRAAAAGGDRDAVRAGQIHRAEDVLARFCEHDPQRMHLVDARVGGIKGARNRVKADFAGNLLLELAPQGPALNDFEWFARQGNPIV